MYAKYKFDLHGYPEWDKRRIKHLIDTYGEAFFKGKTVLEVGCGYAAIGKAMLDLGANVTVSDARGEHIEVVKERYPEIQALVMDSESATWDYPEDKYDIIIHYGLLYHLPNPDDNISLMLKHCEYLFLETEVLDVEDSQHIVYTEEDKTSFGMSFSGNACTPSWAYVERLLDQSNFAWQRVFPEDCPEGQGWHKYNWEQLGNRPLHVSGQRAMWYCKRKEE